MSKLDPLRQAAAVSPRERPAGCCSSLADACLPMNGLLDEARISFRARPARSSPAPGPEAQRGHRAHPAPCSGKTSAKPWCAGRGGCSSCSIRNSRARVYLLLSRLHLGEGNPRAARVSYYAGPRARSHRQGFCPGKANSIGRSRLETGGEERAGKVTVSGPAWTGRKTDDEGKAFHDSRDRRRGTPDADLCGNRRDGIAEGGDSDEDHPPAGRIPQLLPGLRQEDRRRRAALRPARLCEKTLLSAAPRRATGIKASASSPSASTRFSIWYLGNSGRRTSTSSSSSPAPTRPPCFSSMKWTRSRWTCNDLKRSAGRTLINQFLAEMDGNVGSNDGVLILGATNAPWHLDPAFRRPGRFDRIPLRRRPPDEAARGAAIIEVMVEEQARSRPARTRSPWRRRRRISPARI